MTRKDLRGFIEDLEQLPTLPPVAVRLIEVSSSDESGLNEVSRLIENDPALSAKVLKIANSAYFAKSGRVATIERATVVLGLDVVRSLVLSATVFQLLNSSRTSAFDLAKFWTHSAATGIAAQIVARRLKFAKPMEAFVAGLLHDMGKLVMAYWDQERYDEVVHQAGKSGLRLLEVEESYFKIGHTGVAKLVMEKWRFPSQLVEAAWLHHQPLSYFGEKPSSQLPFIVRVANALCHVARIGDGGNPIETWDIDRISNLTGLAVSELNQITLQVLERLEEVSSYFDWESTTPEVYLAAVTGANQELARLQIRLTAKNRRLDRQNNVLEALFGLSESLSETSSVAEALTEILQSLGGFLPHRGLMGYVLLKRSAGLEGLFMSGEGKTSRLYFPLVPDAIERFQGLTGRAQVTLMQEIVKRQADGLENGQEILGLFQDPDLAVLPLRFQDFSIGQLFVLIDADTPDRPDLMSDSKRFAATAAVSLHRLMLIDDLRHEAERLAQMGRRVEDTERRLYHSERLASVGRLAAGAAHEINNPLTIISGHAELLLRASQDAKESKGLEEIIRQIHRISEITSDLMGLARPAEPKMESTRIESVLERTLGLLDQQIRLADVAVHKGFKEVPLISADPQQMEQVFLNLCINAVQAMANGGALTLSIGLAESEEIRIDIGDTGQGIAARDLPSIFDPFFTTKKEGEGTGLGLAICQTIVRNHGGRILVSSHPGKGTTFRILLPLSIKDPSHPHWNKPPSTSNGHSANKRVLVADDEQEIRKLLLEALTSAGLEVEFAEDGAVALEKLNSRDYDLVLLDLRMPEKSGLEVLNSVSERLSRVPIIVISGVAHDLEFEAARKAGAFACLRKPFQIEPLLKVVREALKAEDPPKTVN